MNTKRDSIDHQKVVADRVLEDLSLISPHCILAGGAPRDWFMGEEAEDLDIYFTSAAITSTGALNQLSRCMPYLEKSNIKDINISEQYRKMSSILRIFNFSFEGIKIQLIQLKKPGEEFNVIDNMSCNICKIWCKNSQELRPTDEFYLDYYSQSLTLGEGYTWEDLHPKKIRKKFTKNGYKYHVNSPKSGQLRWIIRSIKLIERILTKIEEESGQEISDKSIINKLEKVFSICKPQ